MVGSLKKIIPLCTFLEFHTYLEAYLARSFSIGSLQVFKALILCYFKNPIFPECFHFQGWFPVRAAHSWEFVFVFCFVSCKTSQGVNILQLCASFSISLNETILQTYQWSCWKNNLKGLKNKVFQVYNRQHQFIFHLVRSVIFINIRVPRLRSTDWKSWALKSSFSSPEAALGKVQFSEHAQINHFIFSTNQILSDVLTLSMFIVTGSLWIADFWCWTFPEAVIHGTDQKERVLWYSGDKNVKILESWVWDTCAKFEGGCLPSVTLRRSLLIWSVCERPWDGYFWCWVAPKHILSLLSENPPQSMALHSLPQSCHFFCSCGKYFKMSPTGNES